MWYNLYKASQSTEYRYCADCVSSRASDIEKMVDNAREVTWNTLIRHVPIEELKMVFPYYEWNNPKGLNLKNDYAVSFYRSTFRGKPCYYVQHSAIEYIFCPEY